ncbi:DUF6443 domain-containing protein [Chryseobacterium sp. CT-SW4]|uniref:DUF6443 domain-containing protein n=1 Tax=Chryseobacterium sp. SW-1 TaxID=3157343 RepID=UPI003B010C7D
MKKIILLISLLFVVGLDAQTTSENYIQSRVYLEPVTVSSTTAKQIQSVQYFDGLGRANQVVNVKSSPLGRDVVTHIEYDQFGRQVKDYLPVPQSNTQNGAIFPTPLSNATQSDIYGNEKIYAEKILENSPLDRVQQQIQVGTDWSTKPVTFEYDANTTADAVRKFTVTTTWASGTTASVLSTNTATYGANQLYKNTVTDEDGNKTIEFKNGQGQVILVRKVNGTENADTYYVYNEYNQLAFVVPPLASVVANVNTVISTLCYLYRYDGRGRQVLKKMPGKAWEYMIYDRQDRLIMSQNVLLGANKQWLFTKYDQFGRVAYTGIYTSTKAYGVAGWAAEQALVDAMGSNNESRSSSAVFTVSGVTLYYTKNAYPTANMSKILSVNYYDTYPPFAGGISLPTQVLGQNILPQNAQSSIISTKGLPTATYIKNIEDDEWTKAYTFYDTKGRAISTHSVNHLGGYTRTESLLDFSGVVQQSKTYHKRLSTDTERIITENFTYDHQNRLLTHTHQVDSNTAEVLAQNSYNELSQLKTKKVGGTSAASPLQTIDYKYNIRGWMTQINDPSNLGADLFGYKIKYHQVEGLESPNGDFTNLKVNPKYNGNIAEIDWRTATAAGDNLRRYGYVYDGLNRLLAGFYQKDTNPSAKEYFEKLDYDLNGNITNLKRSEGAPVGSNTAMLIDNLDYVYVGNQLQSVTDVSGQYSGYPETSGTPITYDLNGNMITQNDKGILQIDYNYLNLPKYILFNKALSTHTGLIRENTSYLYRADGVKLRKIYNYKGVEGSTALLSRTTEYLDGFQYDTTIGKNMVAVLGLKFVPTAEGYYNFENNKYIYNYTDHLGNVRLSYFNNGSGVEVLEENNYYPFGMKHEGYNGLAGNTNYQYKYNGKELQTESGMYDYGARFYMPDIGRWGVIDPLSEKMRIWSPYNYAFNNPLRFIDPDGRKPSDWFVNKYTGNVVKVQGVSNLSQLSKSEVQKLGLGDAKAYERLGKDNMFGKDVQYKGMKLGESKFVMLNNESKGFMKENGYVSADRVIVKETLSTQKGRMGAEENVSHSQSSLTEIRSTKTYVKPEKIETRENEVSKVDTYPFSSVSTVTYDYYRKGTDIGQTPQEIKNTYFYDNNPTKTSDSKNIILQTIKEIVNAATSLIQ